MFVSINLKPKNMKNYQLKCAYCDSEFESKRSDALFCSDSCRTMNSRDKKKREQLSGAYQLLYEADENNIILTKADLVGMTVEEYIKFLSLYTVKDFSEIKSDLKSQIEENKKLKAKLAFFTNDFDGGIYLDLDNDTILDIYEEMNFFWKPCSSIEEYIVYVSLNLRQIIIDTIDKTVGEYKRQ